MRVSEICAFWHCGSDGRVMMLPYEGFAWMTWQVRERLVSLHQAYGR